MSVFIKFNLEGFKHFEQWKERVYVVISPE